MESTAKVACVHCGRLFVPRLSFQASPDGRYFCSQTCRSWATADSQVSCAVCSKSFTPTLAIHVVAVGGVKRFYCSEACRSVETPRVAGDEAAPPRVIAVLNQKGGTGKTTTALHVAAGLARLGHRTLLLDLDPQGNIGLWLGVRSSRSIYYLLLADVPLRGCVAMAREDLYVVTSDQGLAAAEIELARCSEADRTQRLRQAMQGVRGYEYVILDCAPALSVLNHNALSYASEVLIPVSCDYLALVGVRQVMRTLRRIEEQTGHAVRLAGVLPTFYDVRNRVCAEALGYLRRTFGPRALPPVRVNIRLAEAPGEKKTVFEFAPDSHGARDYVRVVEWLRASQGKAPLTRAA